MKILIPTMGTRGDIQPYIYLAKELNNAGYETVIASHPCWQNLVEQSNITFCKIGPDVNIEHEAANIRAQSKNWVLGMIRTMKFMFKIIEESSLEIKELCKEASLVIASHSHIGAAEAEACGVPYVSVTIQPEMIPNKLAKQTFMNRLIGFFLNPMMVGPYNRLRKSLGLKKKKTFYSLVSPVLNIIPISPQVYPAKDYWEDKNKLVGYFLPKENETYQVLEELDVFINSGTPPIVLSLGAMSFESKEEKNKLDLFVNAFKNTGMRAIIQGFNETLKDYPLPENMISIGSVPHSYLFNSAFCVIHHGGFGTTAATLRAGVPAIVIPHVLDQYEWAEKVYQLNAGPKPIYFKDLNEQTLTEAIESLKKHYQEKKNSVMMISEKMRSENGLKTAVELIKGVLGDYNER